MRITNRKRTFFILLYICSVIFFLSCNKSGVDSQTLILKDVNVITMCNDSILIRHSVLIKGSKIIDIGIIEEMEIPKDAHIIDGKDQYLIPGLGDMHVHLSDFDDRFLYIANGVTLVRNMAGLPSHLELREKINNKTLIGPEICTTGLIIDGQNPFWPRISIVVDDREEVFEVLSQMKNEGYDAIKVYDKLTKEVYDEIIRVAKKIEMPVVGHVPQSLDLKEVLFSGQSSIEHLIGYEKYFSDEQIIAETVKSGIWNCHTLLIIKYIENLEYFKKNPPTEIKYVYPSTVRYWKTYNQHYNLLFEKKMELLKSLINNNANIVSGTDASFLYVVAGFSLHEELSLMQDAGLTPYQILLSATRNCAEMLGYESRLGTIEKGKDADLVLLKYNPLDDIKNTKSIVGVMSKGSWYPKEELDSMLEMVAAIKNPLKQKLTIHNNAFLKLIVFLLILTFLSTFLIRPILYIVNKNRLKSFISDNDYVTRYLIPFFVISVSILCLYLLIIVSFMSEAQFEYGLPSALIGVPAIIRYQILLPFLNFFLLIPLLILFTIALLKNSLSAYMKWHSLSIISASIILSVLLNYWGLIKLYL